MSLSGFTFSVVADAGIPMIFFAFPAMVLLLIPIIVIEALLCRKWLGLSTWTAMKANAASNVASTVAGVPMAWACMFAIQLGAGVVFDKIPAAQNWHSPLANVILVLFGSAWLAPPEHNLWAVPAAVLPLLIPFFFASYGIEYLILWFMIGEPEGGAPNLAYKRVRIAVRNANLVTYGAMFIATVIWLLVFLLRYK
jgi:hypothetical protein